MELVSEIFNFFLLNEADLHFFAINQTNNCGLWTIFGLANTMASLDLIFWNIYPEDIKYFYYLILQIYLFCGILNTWNLEIIPSVVLL